jgi:hypothetical protein
MSDANKLTVARLFEQVWNQKNEAAIDEMFHQGRKPMAFLTLNQFSRVPMRSRPFTAASAALFLTFVSTSRFDGRSQ